MSAVFTSGGNSVSRQGVIRDLCSFPLMKIHALPRTFYSTREAIFLKSHRTNGGVKAPK
jgi:hypothetical protein